MRILLVEDHPDTARVLRRLLEREGHEIALATTAAEAIAACKSAEFDLLLCDLTLPDGDGWQLRRDLQAICETPAIALSAHAYADDRKRSLEAGFVAHLAKPVPVTDLLAAIARVAGG